MSHVFPGYISFVHYRFLRALEQNGAQSRLLYLLSSLRSSLFRFFLAGESENQGEVVRTYLWGESKKLGIGGRGGEDFLHCPSPLPLIFLLPLCLCPRATSACLKGNGKDCYAGYLLGKRMDSPLFLC